MAWDTEKEQDKTETNKGTNRTREISLTRVNTKNASSNLSNLSSLVNLTKVSMRIPPKVGPKTF